MSATPLDQRDGQIWLDGRFVRWPDAQLHVLSHGLHYATTVFEGVRVYGGRAFALDAHCRRLVRSAHLIGYSLPYDPSTLCIAATEVVATNGITEGYLRPLAWRGSEGLGLAAEGLSVHVAIAAWPWPQVYAPESQSRGIRLHRATQYRIPPGALPTQAKASAHYLVGALAYQAARSAGCEDALLCDMEGCVAEASTANVFFVEDKTLITPIADRCLNGITRQHILVLAKAEGLTTIERRIYPRELRQFSEAFLTGTAVEVQPISSINNIVYGVGPITRRLAARYRDLTCAEEQLSVVTSKRADHDKIL